jgi:hypothetical protein
MICCDIFTDLITLNLSDKSLLRVPEPLPTLVVLTKFEKFSDCKFNLFL